MSGRHGDPAVPSATAPLLLGLAAVLALVLGGGIWAASVPVSGAVVAFGEVDGTPLLHPVQHAEGGLVAEVAVVDGQTVAAGQLIARLDGARLDHEWQLIEAQTREAEARAMRLRAERDGAPWPGADPLSAEERAQRRLFEARALTLTRQTEQLALRQAQTEAEIFGLVGQDTALRDEALLLAEALDRQRALRARGLAGADRITAFEREAAQLAGRQAALAARRAELRGQLAEIALQTETLHAARREEAEAQLTEITALQLDLASRRAVLAERRAGLELRAPVAGRVHALAVATPGVVMAPGETLAQIIPDTASPLVTLRVRPDDVDRVYAGQPALLRFPALAPLGLPDLAARVRDVSPAILIDERSGARFFRATLVLDAAGVDALAGRSLVPGMAAQGLIATGARTPLAYLLAPVRAQMRAALREP